MIIVFFSLRNCVSYSLSWCVWKIIKKITRVAFEVDRRNKWTCRRLKFSNGRVGKVIWILYWKTSEKCNLLKRNVSLARLVRKELARETSERTKNAVFPPSITATDSLALYAVYTLILKYIIEFVHRKFTLFYSKIITRECAQYISDDLIAGY